MTFSIRPGRASDQEAIAKFTAATFHWGDYVADKFLDWVADSKGQVVVAVDDEDSAFAVGHGVMLSATEAWLHGTRVRADWRRHGVASAMGEALADWARTRGALVARLAVEAWNTAAQRQAEGTGFRPVGSWVVAERTVGMMEPTAATNGGRRSRAHRKLRVTHSSEALPAWVSWRSGPLIGPARGLFARHWMWSRLELEHLEQAARDGALWQSQAGWAHLRITPDRVSVGWLECAADDAPDMVRSIIDLAIESGSDGVHITVPAVEPLLAGLRRSGCELHPIEIYARGL